MGMSIHVGTSILTYLQNMLSYTEGNAFDVDETAFIGLTIYYCTNALTTRDEQRAIKDEEEHNNGTPSLGCGAA